MTWSIVLAGGTGSRLAEQSRSLYGYARPKQFCDFDGTGTLLEKTLRRAAAFSPARRTAVVTTRAHRAEADEALRGHRDIVRIEQPCSRDTTPGIALPLLHVLGRDDDDIVVLLPSDHHVADEVAFAAAVARAIGLVSRSPDRIAVLGADPGELADGYGWILPARRAGGAVVRFVEKPPSELIPTLRDSGALVNTFVLVAWARTLAGLLGRYTAGWWRALLGAWPSRSRLDATYEVLPSSNFSTDVLERAFDRLELVRVPSSAGWSDVGTPSRLARALTPAAAPDRAYAFAG